MSELERLYANIKHYERDAHDLLSKRHSKDELKNIFDQFKLAAEGVIDFETLYQELGDKTFYPVAAIYYFKLAQKAISQANVEESDISSEEYSVILNNMFKGRDLLRKVGWKVSEHPLTDGLWVRPGEEPRKEDYKQWFLEVLEKRYAKKDTTKNMLEVQIARCALSNDKADQHLFTYLKDSFRNKKYKYSWGHTPTILDKGRKQATAVMAVVELLSNNKGMTQRSAAEYVAKHIGEKPDTVRNWYRSKPQGNATSYSDEKSALDTIKSPPFPWETTGDKIKLPLFPWDL